MKPGDYIQPYMVDEPYAKFPPGLLIQIEKRPRSLAGTQSPGNRSYNMYHVLTFDGGVQFYEQPFWEVRKVWHEEISSLHV